MTELSIVIGTRNRPASFLRFYESLKRSMTVPTELVVVDASDPPHYTRLGESSEQIQVNRQAIVSLLQSEVYIKEQPRVGVIRGYNMGFRAAKSEYVCWFNDDCELLPGWDRIALDYMRQYPELGIGAIYFNDHVGGKPKTRIHPRDPNTQITNWEVQSLHGFQYANFGVLRRDLGNKAGWFDESCGFMYGCDNSLCNRVLEAGYAVAPIPGCKVIHYREADSERLGNKPLAKQDRRKYDAAWAHRLDNVKAIALSDKFKHLQQPKAIE